MWEELKFITSGAYLLCRAPGSILAAQTWQILEYLIATQDNAQQLLCHSTYLPSKAAPMMVAHSFSPGKDESSDQTQRWKISFKITALAVALVLMLALLSARQAAVLVAPFSLFLLTATCSSRRP